MPISRRTWTTMSPPSSDVSGGSPPTWQQVDEGWGRRAVDFATLSEPSNCREYVALHHHLAVGPGDRLLDMACGSGLAVELATAVGATCSGIDASPRLIAVARDRNPDADLRAGDMRELPWPDASFDVVTSFRGIWGTTPEAVAEAFRVLAPGGRLGITVWGHIKRSPGAWMMEPLKLATEPKVEHQAAMVALGRPEAGEQLLADCGFVEVRRQEIPFVAEFADPETYARAISSVGPAYEAIENVGEDEFVRAAIAVARQRVRDGLPLRAPIAAVGYIARKPSTPQRSSAVEAATPSFLDDAPPSTGAQRLFDDDVQGLGYVMNTSKVWAHDPAALDASVGIPRSRRRGRGADVSAAGDPRHRLRFGPRRLVLLAGVGQEAGRRRRRRRRRGRAARRRRGARGQRAGARPMGPPTGARSELDHCRRCAVATRRRIQRRSDLRRVRVRGPAHRLLHRQRRARRRDPIGNWARTCRPVFATPSRSAGRSPRPCRTNPLRER